MVRQFYFFNPCRWRIDSLPSMVILYDVGMIRFRMESARAPLPNLSCQFSAEYCVQNTINPFPQHASINSSRSHCSVFEAATNNNSSRITRSIFLYCFIIFVYVFCMRVYDARTVSISKLIVPSVSHFVRQRFRPR